MNKLVFSLLSTMLLTSCGYSINGNNIIVGSLREGILLESSKIYAVDETGTQIPVSAPFSSAQKAEWSPNHKWVTYQTEDTADNNDPRVFIVKTDGTDKITLTNDEYPCGFEPTWSADGKRIAALFCEQNGKDGIYTVDMSCLKDKQDCKFEYQFVAEPGSDPSWSSDGEQLAFLTSRHELAITSLGSVGQIKIISPKDMVCYGVDWSPVDDEIAVSCGVPNMGINIFLINSDGSNLRNISNSESGDFFPVWSPDGTKIAFISDRFGSRPIIYHGISSDAVYVMDKNGANVKRLSPYDNESIQWIDWIDP